MNGLAVKNKYSIRGALWTSLYILLVILPLLVLLLGNSPPGTLFAWDLAIALGFSAMVLMCSMFILTARYKTITHSFGIDIIYYFHRYIALIAFALLLAHPVILIGIEPLLLEYLKPDAPWYMLAGNISLLAVIFLIVTSVWRKAMNLHYDMWRFLHMVFALLAVGLAMLHIVGVSYYIETPWLRELSILYTIAVIFIAFHVRIIRPLRLKRKKYHVTDIHEERGDTWTLAVEPDNHPGLNFIPGQFVWLHLGYSPISMREHPFSIASSADQPQRLQFTIKRLGDFTSAIDTIQPGQPLYIDGPFGAFSIDRHPDSPGYVFIAGGVGIAPILSMLRTLADRNDQRPLWLFYAYNSLDRLTAYEELQDLETLLNLQVIITLNTPPSDWSGEKGFITQEMLQRHLPGNLAAINYFMCGPAPMTTSVEKSLSNIGVPLKHIHTELFDMV